MSHVDGNGQRGDGHPRFVRRVRRRTVRRRPAAAAGVPDGEPDAELTGPAARLRDRLGAVDRRSRAHEHLREVRERRRRRLQRLRVAQVLVAVVAALGLLVAGGLLVGWWGTLPGPAVVGLVAGGRWATGRLAARRGAAAWDWKVGRYRLLGNPAERVQALDRPGDRSRRTSWRP